MSTKPAAKRKAEEASDDKSIPSNENKSETPYALYFAELKAFQKLEENKHVLGPMVIKGIGKDDDDEEDEDDEDTEDEDEEDDPSKYTTEQMKSLRIVLITENRDKELHKMRELILGNQADDDILMFDTSFSYEVLATWNRVKKSLSIMKDPSKKLDKLFAYTFQLKEFDPWMHDNEGGMEVLVTGLASAWKTHLNKFSDEELGWDCKYTKPGMLEFLNQFKKQVESVPDYCSIGEFNFQ